MAKISALATKAAPTGAEKVLILDDDGSAKTADLGALAAAGAADAIAPAVEQAESAAALATSRAAALNTAVETLVEWTAMPTVSVAGQYVSTASGLPVANGAYQYTAVPIDETETGIRITSAAVRGVNTALAVYLAEDGDVLGIEQPGTANDVVITPANPRGLALPPGTRTVMVTSLATTPIAVEHLAVAPNLALRIASAEQDVQRAATTANTATAALQTWNPVAVAIVADKYIARTGAEGAVAGYRYTKLAIAPTDQVLVSTLITGTNAPLAVYYKDAACTQYLDHQAPGDGVDHNYVREPLLIPAAARGVAINGRSTVPIKVERRGTAIGLGDRLDASEQGIGTLTTRVAANENTVAGAQATLGAVATSLQAWAQPTSAVIDNKYISRTSGNEAAVNGYRYVKLAINDTDVIRVSTLITGTAVALATYYSDAAGTAKLSNQADGDGTSRPYDKELLTIPPGAKAVAINGRTTVPIVIERRGVAADVGQRLSALEGAGVVSPWRGKTIATLGDSITAGKTWQDAAYNAFGITWTGYGIGGTKISGPAGDANAMCQDTRINAIPTTVDAVVMMGGTNDWAQDVPLGAFDSTDPTTFCGALNTLAAKMFARWPTKRLAWATTPYGEMVAWSGRPGWTSPAINKLGLTTNDYAEAMRVAAKRNNVSLIDVALYAGWGRYNIAPALGGSTTDNLHPIAGSPAAQGIAGAHRGWILTSTPITAIAA